MLEFIRSARLIGAAAALVVTATSAQAEPRAPVFDDVTQSAGIAHLYGTASDFVVGGGGAAFDCNADGFADVALAGGDHPFGLYVNRATGPGALRFERKSIDAPLDRATGAYPLDIDSDGVMDLFVLRFGRNTVLRGLGDCAFEDATEALGLPVEADWTTAFAATWEQGQSLPTLAIGNYVPRDRPLRASDNCEPSYLLRPDGARYGAPIPLGKGACTLSAMFVDWAGNGLPDLRMANDREYYDAELSDQLWRLTPGGPVQYGEADGWAEPKLWGMGLAAQDITGDGRPEVAVTSMADNRFEQLAALDGRPDFQDIAFRVGATAHRPYTGGDTRPSTAWHTEFADFNNDAFSDLLIVKGNVDAMPKMANFDPDNLLLGTAEGFQEVGAEAGIGVDTRGRGAIIADFDHDGALDLITVNRGQPARVFRQQAPAGNAVTIDPQMQGTNRYAVGASVSLRTPERTSHITRRVGGGHAGGTLLPLHFGLGSAERAEVRITWPDGSQTGWFPVQAGARIALGKVAR